LHLGSDDGIVVWMAARSRLTYDDYAALPDDGNRYELLAGVLYVVPAPNPLHQRVSKRLQRQLEAFFEERGLGEVFDAPVDVILGCHDVAEPDILVVGSPQQISHRAIEGAPLLVVEVLSPSSRRHDRVLKAERYLTLGVGHYWIVDPESRELACMRATQGKWELVASGRGDDEVCDPSWPALTIRLAVLWKAPPQRL
jgi:Uma2 family endonuclease